MPTTIATILVFIFGLLPGFCADYFFRIVSGSDWRDKDWESGLRLIGLSVLGLFLYVVAAAFFDGIPALHIIPASFEHSAFSAESLPQLLIPFAGHTVLAAVGGFWSAKLLRSVSKKFGTSSQSSTWNHFIAEEVKERWVVVTLHSGEVYAGMLLIAEQGVAQSERDLVLRSPALRMKNGKNYKVLPYRDIFLPSQLVQNIGTLRHAGETDIPTEVGKSLFRRYPNDETQHLESTHPPAPRAIGRRPKGRRHAPLAEDSAIRASSSSSVDADKEVRSI